MNKKQLLAREENVRVLSRNYPGINADTLESSLYRLALKLERNAENLCNVTDYADKHDQVRASLKNIAKRHGLELRAKVGGDPRGFCLKLILPDGTYNTLGGVEDGYGIGRV